MLSRKLTSIAFTKQISSYFARRALSAAAVSKGKQSKGKQPASTNVEKKNSALKAPKSIDKSPLVVSTKETKVEGMGVTGSEYNNILQKKDSGEILGLSNLRKLLATCILPEHVNLAVKAVTIYQEEGHDFATDVNSLFVKACISGGQPKAAADIIIRFKNRIGAWTSPTSLHRLVESLVAENRVDSIVGVIAMVYMKGSKPLNTTLELAVSQTSILGDKDLHAKVEQICIAVLGKSVTDTLMSKYPLTVKPTAVPQENKEEQGNGSDKVKTGPTIPSSSSSVEPVVEKS